MSDEERRVADAPGVSEIDWEWWEDRLGYDSPFSGALHLLGQIPHKDYKHCTKEHGEIEAVHLAKLRELFERVAEELEGGRIE